MSSFAKFAGLVFLSVLIYAIPLNADAQSNVSIFSISPTSGNEGTSFVLTGSNFLQCDPLHITSACNVQFHDTSLRRSTISGSVQSDSTITQSIPGGLCPGKYSVRVGSLTDFSNSVTFDLLPDLSPSSGDPSSGYCRYISSISPTSGLPGANITISGQNLHTTVRFYNSSGVETTATGTASNTYPFDTGTATGTIQLISEVMVKVPAGLTAGVYSVRVGTNTIVTNSTTGEQFPDISNAVDFNVQSTGGSTIPVVSGVKIINITSNSATVTWDTDKPTDGQVEYCLTSVRCGLTTPVSSGLTTSHSINLTGLKSDTSYYVWVRSRDSSGNLKTSGYYTFRTLRASTAVPATPTPSPSPTPTQSSSQGSIVISNLQVSNITRDSATVTWDTDKPSDSTVLSCFFGFLCFTTLNTNPTLTKSHTVNISNLKADRVYYIKVRSSDSNDASGYSAVVSFRTLPGLIMSNLNLVSVTQTSVTVAWDTNYVADSRISVCTNFIGCFFTAPAIDASLVMGHSMTVSGLTPGTTYNFRVTSVDPAGYVARSDYQRFRTLD